MSLAHTFPFHSPKLAVMHRAVVAHIQSAGYKFELPVLSQEIWERICDDPQERERLEFVGDSRIGSFVSEELYKCRPSEGPGFYTCARSILTANATFAHIMHKAGFHNINNPVKPAGDALETIIAAFYTEQGLEAFQSYAKLYFVPLIQIASKAYDEFRRTSKENRRRKNHELNVSSLLHHARARKIHKLAKKRPVPFKRPRSTPTFIDLTTDDPAPESEVKDVRRCHQRSSSAMLTPLKLAKKNISEKPSADEGHRSQEILRFISDSPQIKRTTKRSNHVPSSLAPQPPVPLPSVNSCDLEEDLVKSLKRTFISGTGTINNPFLID